MKIHTQANCPLQVVRCELAAFFRPFLWSLKSLNRIIPKKEKTPLIFEQVQNGQMANILSTSYGVKSQL